MVVACPKTGGGAGWRGYPAWPGAARSLTRAVWATQYTHAQVPVPCDQSTCFQLAPRSQQVIAQGGLFFLVGKPARDHHLRRLCQPITATTGATLAWTRVKEEEEDDDAAG